MAHTPGPWMAIKSPSPLNPDSFGVIAVDPMRGRIDSQLQGMTEDNAHLIAAAPELLEALHEIRDHLYTKQDIARCRAIATEVIAKAEGC